MDGYMCEKHVVTPYIAEFWNTMSNLVMIALAFWRSFCRSNGHKQRFVWSFIGLATVGCGSSCSVVRVLSIVLTVSGARAAVLATSIEACHTD